MKNLWRRVAPWLTIVLVAVEIVLVWTGVLSLLNAVIIIVAVEVLLGLTVLSRGIVAYRRFRAERGEGQDPWVAAEDGLSQMLPRRVAQVLLVEARMWLSLLGWVARRRPPGTLFSYGATLRPIMRVVLGLLVVEGVVVEVVLFVLLGHGSPWSWLSLGLHVYGLIWVGGFLGSLTVLPHQLRETVLVLRDSAFTTITVPLAGIASTTARRRGNTGRSGWKVEDGVGLLAHGDATVGIELHPDAGVRVGDQPAPDDLHRLDVTADDPSAFVEAVREACNQVSGSEVSPSAD